jgi:hypothetical protein
LGTPPAGTGEGGGLTAGQLALGGARMADAARAEAAYADIKASLHTDWKDWSITDADVRRVYAQLEKLPPADYRQMLERMERDRLLGKYAEQMSPESRKEFLSQAERKGYLTREPGKEAPRAAGNPPDAPTLYRHDASLPSSVGKLVHEENRVAKNAYANAHHAYVQRFAEQALEAKDMLALRTMGEPVAPFSVSEPGMTAAHPDYQRYRSSWADVKVKDTRSQAYQAVDRRTRDLSDAQRAGTLAVRRETELSVESEGMSVKVSKESTLTQYGKTGGSWKVGGEIEREGLKSGASIESSGAVKTEKGADLGVGSVSIDSEGTVRMEVSVPGTDYTAYSEFNHEQGTFGGGVSVEKDFLGAKRKTEYGVTMQGARLDRAQDIASTQPGTLYGPLPELDQRLAWKDIPTERRALMERDGWNADQWAAALQQKASKR